MRITPEIQKLFSQIDRDEFPETINYLLSLISSDEDAPTQFQIATDLLDCDKPKPFPDFIVSYITDLFQREIEDGNTNAMNDLGAQYYGGGRGFEQSFEKAVALYQQAAQHGNRKAQENLGYCYYYGRDGSPDYEKAFQYFALGAFDGWPISMYKIGDMYLNGFYVEKNEVEAFILYNRCLRTMPEKMAKYASGPVHLRLGKMYLEGVGTEVDMAQALWHFHAAEFFLYAMVKDGDYMYKKSLREAIDGQNRARELLDAELPADEWTFDDKRDVSHTRPAQIPILRDRFYYLVNQYVPKEESPWMLIHHPGHFLIYSKSSRKCVFDARYTCLRPDGKPSEEDNPIKAVITMITFTREQNWEQQRDEFSLLADLILKDL